MKRASYSFLLPSLLLSLAALSLPGCANKVHVAAAENGKAVLSPDYGDLIIWRGLQVHFLVSPCKETEMWTSQCTVNIKAPEGQMGQYSYVCRNGACIDPEVDVGSSTTMHQYHWRAGAVRNLASDFQVALPCNSGTIQPSPSDVPDDIYNQPVVPGDVLEWKSNGIGSQFLPDWIVAFDGGNAAVCNEADIHDADGFRTCTIKPGLAGQAYKYQVTSSKCSQGSGTVTVSTVPHQ